MQASPCETPSSALGPPVLGVPLCQAHTGDILCPQVCSERDDDTAKRVVLMKSKQSSGQLALLTSILAYFKGALDCATSL